MGISLNHPFSMGFSIGWGPQDSVQLPYKWLNSMVYGRYNELANGGFVMVYKPTNITGGPILYKPTIFGIPPHFFQHLVTSFSKLAPPCRLSRPCRTSTPQASPGFHRG